MTGAVVGDEPPVVPPAVLPEALPDDGKDAAEGVAGMGGLVTAGAGAFVAGALAAGAAFAGTVEASPRFSHLCSLLDPHAIKSQLFISFDWQMVKPSQRFTRATVDNSVFRDLIFRPT
jgi:hypothetical protein